MSSYLEALIDWLSGRITSVERWVRASIGWVEDWVDYLRDEADGLKDDIHSVQSLMLDIEDWVRGEISDVKMDIMDDVSDNLITPLSNYVDALNIDIHEAVDVVNSDIVDISHDMNTVFDVIDNLNDKIDARIEQYKEKMVGWVQDKFISIVENVMNQEM